MSRLIYWIPSESDRRRTVFLLFKEEWGSRSGELVWWDPPFVTTSSNLCTQWLSYTPVGTFRVSLNILADIFNPSLSVGEGIWSSRGLGEVRSAEERPGLRVIRGNSGRTDFYLRIANKKRLKKKTLRLLLERDGGGKGERGLESGLGQ